MIAIAKLQTTEAMPVPGAPNEATRYHLTTYRPATPETENAPAVPARAGTEIVFDAGIIYVTARDAEGRATAQTLVFPAGADFAVPVTPVELKRR